MRWAGRIARRSTARRSRMLHWCGFFQPFVRSSMFESVAPESHPLNGGVLITVPTGSILLSGDNGDFSAAFKNNELRILEALDPLHAQGFQQVAITQTFPAT